VVDADENGRFIAAHMTRAVESHRVRARSLASLVATAAAALVAGIVFSDWGGRLTTVGIFFAVLTLVLLLLAASFLIAGSMYSDSEADDSLTPLGRVANWFGGGRQPDGDAAPDLDVDALASDSLAVMSRITTRTRIGAVALALAGAAFVTTVSIAWFAPERVSALVTVDEPPAGCSDIGTEFEGAVVQADLNERDLIPVRVVAAECGGKPRGAQEFILLVPATSVVIVR